MPRSADEAQPGPSSPSESECETVKCLVCGGVSRSAHFGARTCRACAAFFRRCVALDCHYTCKRDNRCAVAKQVRFYCRACRYAKCVAIGMKEEGVQQCIKATKKVKAEPGSPEVEEKLLNRQLTSSWLFRGGMFSGDRTLSCAEVNHVQMKDIKLVSEFPKYAFKECSSLPPKQYEVMNMHFFYHFFVLEVGFLTYQTGQWEILHFPNNFTHRFTDPASYAVHSDGTPNPHAAEVAKLFVRHEKLHIQLMHRPMERLKLDETEMLAVGALLFWMKDTEGLSEQTIALCARMHEKIMNELMEYIQTKKGRMREGIRLSQIALLVSNVQRMAQELRSIFEVHKVFQLYRANPELYDAINGSF